MESPSWFEFSGGLAEKPGEPPHALKEHADVWFSPLVGGEPGIPAE